MPRSFATCKGTHWTLIARGATCPIPNGVLPGLRIIRIGSDCAYQDQTGALEKIYDTTEGDLILIRPDGYIGAVISTAGGGWISDYLENVLNKDL
ncbi:hypothetical protein MMA231_03585 (plasmid) [Asticcacaulis sp. MM231]|uniref:hypothetical protein n=1 Tax=Asticcacaulis sp. MM231 TaxID=3157666 RepID=UPI0032D5A6B8